MKSAVLLLIVVGAWDRLYETNSKCPWVKKTDLAQERCSVREAVSNELLYILSGEDTGKWEAEGGSLSWDPACCRL